METVIPFMTDLIILVYKFENLSLNTFKLRTNPQRRKPIDAHRSKHNLNYNPKSMPYLLAFAPCQRVDLALSGPDYQLGNKKHMLQITVRFTENVWTLTSNTSVSTNVCVSSFKSLRTLITRSSVYFRARQTLNYQWILNHLWTISLRVLKLSNQVWNFMEDINALLTAEHLYAWCDMYPAGGYDTSLNDAPFCCIFLFHASKEEQSQYFPRTRTLVYVWSTTLRMGDML